MTVIKSEKSYKASKRILASSTEENPKHKELLEVFAWTDSNEGFPYWYNARSGRGCYKDWRSKLQKYVDEYELANSKVFPKFKPGDRVYYYNPDLTYSREESKKWFVGTVLASTGNGAWKVGFEPFNTIEYSEKMLHKLDEEEVTDTSGGPSSYYNDFPEKVVTANDVIEHLSKSRWFEYSCHMKDIFKAITRWGTKEGTSREYDARKIIYSGCRLLMMMKGTQEVRKTLQSFLDDPQFKGE